MKIHLICALGVVAFLLLPHRAEGALAINWADWSYPDSQHSVATVGSLNATLTPQGPNTTTVNFGTFQFDSAGVSPPNLQEVGWVRGQNPNAIWGYSLTFSGASTNGVIIGLGNFGHISGDPAWKLSAFDASDTPIDLSTFTQIGSFDHTWVSEGNQHFNDDLTLNTSTGVFSIATIDGVNDINSDVMLFSLPNGVSRITVTSVAAYTNDDTHNIIVGELVTAVPAPGGLLTWFVGTMLMTGTAFGRHRRERRTNS